MRLFVFYLARRHIRHRALQAGLTVVGVAVGVMVLVTALSLTNGFIDELVSSTLRATPHVTLQSYDRSPLAQDPAVLEALAAEPGVEAAGAYVLGQALIARPADTRLGLGARTGFTTIFGIEPRSHSQVLELTALEANLDALEGGEGLILGQSLARNLDVFAGDEVRVVFANQARAAFRVAGTFSVGNEMIDAQVAFSSLATLQDFLRMPGEISGYQLRLFDPERATTVGRRVALDYGLLARTWQEQYRSLIEQLNLQKALIGVVVFLIVLVAAMGIANILILTVSEKTEEIAILRALGASRGQILAVFTLEGFILGGGGTLLGALMGLGLSLYFKFQPFPLPGDIYFITRLPVTLQAWDFIWVCALALVTSVVAGLIPARRASGLDPAKILR
ncbi:MAG: ABC transporter permease [Deinococcota bacterium]|nr:ABC transporter permease [Deinococcota bacterium]